MDSAALLQPQPLRAEDHGFADGYNPSAIISICSVFDVLFGSVGRATI